ncbi:aldo/keto reductase family protein [Thiorhodovibrio frisius]|uniref:Aldo/keto reductase, diketogulonate reductase n=1 Tax=Thiorhodovibrio frisius TaxID=631362 RepID=H8Z7I8_9GAMM|nr:aldo/keto reductase [Thiorhodovibrio frisius]EIC20918.1 aldo/keto reductase, diketogulonate reductase [Thiorhodovibrio frisius]WPL21977.1 Glyoxal reductase [Thiorhodovibrio frisius]
MHDNGSDLRTITLHNGVAMPSLAFGCAFGDWVGRTAFQGFLPEQAWRAISLALDNGYRAFDGARVYGTERILGTLLGQRFASGELSREELFITTKLAHPAAPPHINISHRRTWDADKVEDIAQKVRDDMVDTLDDLGLGYVDLLLMHWPGSFSENTTGDPDFPRKARATIWRTFCELADKGAARAIGVSNFTIGHLRQLMEDVPESERRPTVNQVEIHPYCRDPQLETFCREQGIVVTAYAPFASGAFDLLRNPTLTAIAERHGKTTGQVVLRWHVQSGRTALPKTSKAARMAENRDIFDFALSDEEIQATDSLGTGEARRTCPDPSLVA